MNIFTTITQIFWPQPWTPAAGMVLDKALDRLGMFVAEPPSQRLDLVSGTVGGIPLSQCAFRAPAGPRWSCLHLPRGVSFGESLAAAMVGDENQTVLLLQELERVAWGFSLFHTAEPVRRFVSLAEMGKDAPPSLPVDASAVARVLGVSAERFLPYLEIQSPDEVSVERAFPNDEFALGDTWVRVDFLRALGITYPAPATTPLGRYCRLVSALEVSLG